MIGPAGVNTTPVVPAETGTGHDPTGAPDGENALTVVSVATSITAAPCTVDNTGPWVTWEPCSFLLHTGAPDRALSELNDNAPPEVAVTATTD